MSTWTVDQVLALAPDDASVSAGKELASASKWVLVGVSNVAVWGEAKGSGTRPYQTAIDLREVAYKCSCPSRKFPCKHTLGLLLRHARDEVSQAETPEWVSDWLTKRAEPKGRDKAAGATDPKAAAKRTEKRWANIIAGIGECEAFLADAVSQGLTSMHSARSWNQMAARMVDAQAPGIARKLHKIAATIGVGSDWGIRAASEMGRITLVMEAARNIEGLDPGLASDTKAVLGIPMREDDLSEDEAVIDVWAVLGQTVEEEDRLTVYRSWVAGLGTGRWAMHLAFSVAGQAPSLRLLPGFAFAALAKFYPSAWPLRAAFQEVAPCQLGRPKGADWTEAQERLCDALSKNPWIEYVPVLLSDALLARLGERWYALDRNGAAFPLIARGDGCWKALALSGGSPCDLFGEWNGGELRLLSAVGEWGFASL